ncbi:MAG: site-specific DNA-methyltransferase [Bacteroidaceae bacterium]|nr:site-specific DNA-methyltransferase [Bacteroidaceae bacterium]
MKYDYIYHGDCLNFLPQLPDKSINLLVTDPPYLVTKRGSAKGMGGYWTEEKALKGKIFDHNDCHISKWLPEVVRVLKDRAHCYIMCNNVNLLEYLQVIKGCGLHFVRSLIWDKVLPICGTGYMTRSEYILFCYKGGVEEGQ